MGKRNIPVGEVSPAGLFYGLKTISDPRGNLTVAERLPFDIKRVYWIHGVPAGAMRGAHAHKKVRRVFVALSGSFLADIDGERIVMMKPDAGVLIEPLTWVELHDFSPGAICLVLASEEHDETDCIRSREELEALR